MRWASIRVAVVCAILPPLGTLWADDAPLGEDPRAATAPNRLRDTAPDLWTATDALHRRLPDQSVCGPPRPGKFVGMFYFLWLEPAGKPLLDITKLLAANPEHPAWGPPGFMHWWGEPRFGYYDIQDPWVLAKHAQMLADAGVDVLFFDVTNGPTYDECYLSVCKVFTELRATGRKTPQIAFLTHTHTSKVVDHLLERLYRPNLYPELWFRWDGKPLLLANPAELSPATRDFFTVRESWAWSKGQGWFGDGRDKWTWLDNYPQNAGWHDSPDRPEAISVCVSQHATSNIGRSFHDGREPAPAERAPEKGLCFAEQWRRAREVDPAFIFVTGWNEWVAGRFLSDGHQPFLGHIEPQGGSFFVDEYSQEFSRDIEPMRGGHADNYYYQLVDNIRRYKGVSAQPMPSAEKTIPIGDDFAAWNGVGPDYLDDLGDTLHRKYRGWGAAAETPYVNESGRNDLALARVARDDQQIYFYLQSRAPLSSGSPPGGLWLLLDIDADTTAGRPTGWQGYDFVVNRRPAAAGKVSLERHVLAADKSHHWRWETVAEVSVGVRGAELQFAVPRAKLGLEKAQGPLTIDFKWVDNVPESGDPLDFLDHGDVAPNGRFNYRFAESPRD